MLEQKSYLTYIHNFRGLAIIFIVAYHTLISFAWSSPLSTKNIVLSIASNGTILFVFISGFLFYYLFNSTFNYLEYLIKKMKFVILPYIIVSLPAIVEKLFYDSGNHWWMTENYHNQPTLYKALIMIVTGRHSGALWFIPMISIFYLLSPILIRFSRTNIFNISVLLIYLLGLFSVSFGYYSNPIISFIHFLPVYLLGMWACKFRQFLFENIKMLFPLITFIYLSMTVLEILQIIDISDYIKLRDSGIFNIIFNLSKLKATLFCFMVILFFYQFDTMNWAFFSLTGRYSFGIFFIHLYIIEGIQRLTQINSINFKLISLLTLPLLIFIILFFSIMFTKTIKILFKDNSRMIIGS